MQKLKVEMQQLKLKMQQLIVEMQELKIEVIEIQKYNNYYNSYSWIFFRMQITLPVSSIFSFLQKLEMPLHRWVFLVKTIGTRSRKAEILLFEATRTIKHVHTVGTENIKYLQFFAQILLGYLVYSF